MFRLFVAHLFFFLLSFKFIIIKADAVEEIKRRLSSQISSLKNEENFKYMLNKGGIFDCDKKYCSQISFLESQIKKNQIQKFPQINMLKSNVDIDLSKIIIAKIFFKHAFPIESNNYQAGINSISNLVYFNLYLLKDEEENNLIDITPSSIGYENLLVYLPLYMSDSLRNKLLSISGQNPENEVEDLKDYDIFDPESKIYNNICYPVTFSSSSENVIGIDSFKNFDITLEQRKKYYFPGNLNLCPFGCSYQGIDRNTISSVCKCNEEYFLNIQTDDYIENEEYINFSFKEKDFYNSNKDNIISINTLKCLKLPFTSKGFKNNYGSIGMIILALVVIVCFLILVFIGKEHLIFVLELLCNSIPKTDKIFVNDVIGINYKDNNMNLKSYNESNSNNDILISLNKKKLSNKEKNKPNPPKKKYSLIGDGIELDSKRKENKKIKEEFNKEEDLKKDETHISTNIPITNDKPDEKLLLKIKEQYEKELKKLKEKNEKDMKKLKKEKDSEIKKLQNDLENLRNQEIKITNNIKLNDVDVKALLVTVPLNALFTEQEMNSMSLEQSLNYDKRKLCQIYYSFINIKQPLFFLFNYYTKINNPNFQIKFNSLRIIIFCYEIMIYSFFYVTFFGSKSITKIYLGTFTFGKKCILGMILSPFCMVIKSIMHYFIYNSMNKKIVMVKLKSYSYFVQEKNKYNKNLQDEIENEKNIKFNNENKDDKKENLNNEFIGFVQDLLNYLKKSFLIFSIVSIFVLFFEWCLVSSFCSVYKNSQIEFFISVLVCYLFSNIYAFIYCFIPAIFRYFAVKNNSSLLFIVAEITKVI